MNGESGKVKKRVDTISKEVGFMAKAKKGDLYACDECGLVVCVEDPCECISCELICCDVPMARKPARRKAAAGKKKTASRTKAAPGKRKAAGG
ncbi:MAG TPA: hypothetical protein PK120_00085 [Syntrophales bacterium]|jgi:hypothetical protein|nr:hypothetical protein [Syntrophales bacterium]